MELSKSDYYDLRDPNFGWRGRYRILKIDAERDLVYIENLGTHSKQYVKSTNLRPSSCKQFSLQSSLR